MGDIVLSAGVRKNLLSLQSTADMMALTQNRLATGKKVNSALDNPFNFFTSAALNNRAGDMNALLDAIGQSQKTLEQADIGITAITKLVESAKSLAKQARQSTQPVATYNQTITGAAIAADVPASATSTATAASVYGAATAGDTLSITVGGTTHNFTYVASGASAAAGTFSDTAELQAAITAAGLTDITVAEDGTGHLKIDAASGSFTVGGDMGTDFGFATTANTPSNPTFAGLTPPQSLSIKVGAGATETFNITASTTRDDLATWLGGLHLPTGVSASLNASGQVAITSTTSDVITVTGTGNTATTLGLVGTNNGVYTPAVTVTTPSQQRADYQSEYNKTIAQIDSLARDSSYNGVNLLASDTLKVVFNEDGSSFLNIEGVDFTSAGLGLLSLDGDDFQNNLTTDAVITKLDNALRTLRTQASTFGTKLGTVETRQNFTKSLIQTLKTGADNLVLADPNEEGANMLALQTRQQLSTTALSLSAQADQAVLRLFG